MAEVRLAPLVGPADARTLKKFEPFEGHGTNWFINLVLGYKRNQRAEGTEGTSHKLSQKLNKRQGSLFNFRVIVFMGTARG